jgi:apolipoprotein N-acyltransferase
VPLLLVLVGAWTGRVPRYPRAFGLGLLAGAGYFAGTVYWTTSVMETYGDVSLPVAVALAGALVAYLALFPALFAVLVASVARSLGVWALAMSPAFWVSTELLRTHLFTGFPWVLLGYSQSTVPPVIQVASLFGVFGVSGLVAFGNAAVAWLAVTHGRRRLVGSVVAVLVLAAAVGWGGYRTRDGRLTAEGTPLRVALVQGNIPQDQKWDPARAGQIIERYFSLSRQAAREGARFIIWPESSLPFYLEEEPGGRELVEDLVRETGVSFLIGSDQLERGPVPRYYNAAFLLGPDGGTVAVYRKMHLVPFGEYVPLRRLFFFLSPLVEAVSDFSPGDRPVMLPVEGYDTSTAICYEVVYPGLIRQSVIEGSRLLTTITNDAWYGRSSAPHQHFWQAAMRAVEQGRYMARAANTGISGIVDPYGRVAARTEIFETGVLVGEVRLLTSRTIYSRIGDLFAYACAALTLAAVIAVRSGRPAPRRRERVVRSLP